MRDIYRNIWELTQGGKPGVLVTVVEKEGEGPALAGNKMLVYEDGSTTGTVGGGNLEFLATRKASKILQSGKNELESFNLSDDQTEGTPTGMACGGKATLFFEFLGQSSRVYIFGAGHIGKALYEILTKMEVAVTLMDDRAEMIEEIKIPGEKLHANFVEFIEETKFHSTPLFVLATYKHQHDSHILNKIFEKQIQTPYIGIIASKKTRRTLIQSLQKKYGEKTDLTPIHSPAGLDIGGTDHPWEIALSVAAEIQTLRYNKNTNHLKDKK